MLETAVSVVAAAERATSAAVRARRARRFAVAAATQVTAGETGLAAVALRSLVTAQAACLAEAAAQAPGLIDSSGTEAQNSLVAEGMAATVQAADTATADSAFAAARVAHPFTDSVAHVAAMVAGFDLPLEREAPVAAQAVHGVPLGPPVR
jgi:hypothetical protein